MLCDVAIVAERGVESWDGCLLVMGVLRGEKGISRNRCGSLRGVTRGKGKEAGKREGQVRRVLIGKFYYGWVKR